MEWTRKWRSSLHINQVHLRKRFLLLLTRSPNFDFSDILRNMMYHNICEPNKVLSVRLRWRSARTPGGGAFGSIFAGYVPLASPNPYPIIVYSVANDRPHVSHFWANIPQIPTCRNLLAPEIPQMCDPILVTLLAPNENATPLVNPVVKMRPHPAAHPH